MNEKIYCSIMNRIRKLARENGEKEHSVMVKINLIGGNSFKAELGDVHLEDGYISAWTQKDTYCFVPVQNILSIEV